MPEYIHRMVSLEATDFEAIHQVAHERGMGKKGFSRALRTIIREWQACQKSQESASASDEAGQSF